jgi:hypothetical protein
MQTQQAQQTRQPGVQQFTHYRRCPTSNGSAVYRITSIFNKEVCRVDERFLPLIEAEIAAIDNGEAVDFVCIPDLAQQDDFGWRLDLEYYRGRMADEPETPSFPPASDLDGKNVTFLISKEDHAFITNLYKQMKHVNSRFSKFSDLNSYIFETAVRSLRLSHPDLDVCVDEAVPF